MQSESDNWLHFLRVYQQEFKNLAGVTDIPTDTRMTVFPQFFLGSDGPSRLQPDVWCGQAPD